MCVVASVFYSFLRHNRAHNPEHKGTRGCMRGGRPVMIEKRETTDPMQCLDRNAITQAEQSNSVEFFFFFFFLSTCNNKSYVHFLFAILKNTSL